MNSVCVKQLRYYSSPALDNSSGQGCFCGKVVYVIQAVVRLVKNIKRNVGDFLIKLKEIITRHCVVCCRNSSTSGRIVIPEDLRNHKNVDICRHGTHVADNRSSSVSPVSEQAMIPYAAIIRPASPEAPANTVDTDLNALVSQQTLPLPQDITKPESSLAPDQPPWIRSDSETLPVHDLDGTCSSPTKAPDKHEANDNGAACAAGHDCATGATCAVDMADAAEALAVQPLVPHSDSIQPAIDKEKRQAVIVNSLVQLTDEFQALDAIMAEKGISFSPAIQMRDLPGPLTFKDIVLAADFELICDLAGQYPEHFEHIHGLLYCLFCYGMNNPKRHTFADVNLEKLTFLFNKGLLSEPDLVLLDTLTSIHKCINCPVGQCTSEPEHIRHTFVQKLKEYESEITRELGKRKFFVGKGLPIEIRMISRILEAEGTIFLHLPHLEKLVAIVCEKFEHSLGNNDERLRWLIYLKDDALAATAILFHAVDKHGMEIIQQMKSAEIQINITAGIFMSNMLASVINCPLLHVVAATFDLRVPKHVLAEILRNRWDKDLPISTDVQRNYQTLTGEAFDADQILGPDDYCYDHKLVLATPSSFDSYPEGFCLKHPRRTTLYEWSVKDQILTLIRGVERPFKGNYKIVIVSHGDGLIISDKDKYAVTESPLGGKYVADQIHQLITQKKGDNPAKITLSYCNIGNNIPLINFRSRFTERIAHLGYRTMVTAPRIGCPSISPETGRTTYVKEGLLGLTLALPFIKKCLPFWNEVQTKDKKRHDYFIGMGYKRVNYMKAVYRIENGKVTELANPDLPELV